MEQPEKESAATVTDLETRRVRQVQERQVTQSNALVEASYKLNLNEKRLVLCAVAQIDSRLPLDTRRKVTVTAEDFATAFDMQPKHVYEILSDACDSLYERDVKTHDGKVRERFRWISHAKYGQGYVQLSFSPEICPYLGMLNREFTSYRLRQVSGLRSIYSIRLFTMLMQWKSVGELTISVDKLRDSFQLEDQYPRFFDLKKRVIVPAVQELQEKSGLDIAWRPVKKGRAVVGLHFEFQPTAQFDLFTEGEPSILP